MELPLVPYGDTLMLKKADASRSTRFFPILKHIRRSKTLCDTPMNENLDLHCRRQSAQFVVVSFTCLKIANKRMLKLLLVRLSFDQSVHVEQLQRYQKYKHCVARQ